MWSWFSTPTFELVNRSDTALTDVRLVAEHSWGEHPPEWEIGTVDHLAPGESSEVQYDPNPPSHLRVEFTSPRGRTVERDVMYVDSDEVRWGRTVCFEIGSDYSLIPRMP